MGRIKAHPFRWPVALVAMFLVVPTSRRLAAEERQLGYSLHPHGGWKEHRIYRAPQQYKGLKDVLFHNEGNGTFRNVSAEAGIEEAEWNGLGVVCGDLDMDGDPDICVGDDASPNLLWINRGDGTGIEFGRPTMGVRVNQSH